MATGLDNHHRNTLKKLFEHPPSRNVEWREVVSLLETVGTVTPEANGKLRVTVGPETEILRPPHGKDVGEQMIVDLRRMLENAGFGPEGLPVIEVRDPAAWPPRDEGDSRRGAP